MKRKCEHYWFTFDEYEQEVYSPGFEYWIDGGAKGPGNLVIHIKGLVADSTWFLVPDLGTILRPATCVYFDELVDSLTPLERELRRIK